MFGEAESCFEVVWSGRVVVGDVCGTHSSFCFSFAGIGLDEEIVDDASGEFLVVFVVWSVVAGIGFDEEIVDDASGEFLVVFVV